MGFELYGFTDLSTNLTTSGGPIFRCTTKDRGERRVKGGATPFNPLELMLTVMPDVLCAYHLATVQLTRLSRLRCREANTLGVRFAYSLASLYCADCVSCVSANHSTKVGYCVGYGESVSKTSP